MQTLGTGPCDHGTIISAKCWRRHGQAKARSAGNFIKRLSQKLIGGNPAGHNKPSAIAGRHIKIIYGDATAIDQAIGNCGLKPCG